MGRICVGCSAIKLPKPPFYTVTPTYDAHYHYWDKMYRNNDVEVIDGNERMTNTSRYDQDRVYARSFAIYRAVHKR